MRRDTICDVDEKSSRVLYEQSVVEFVNKFAANKAIVSHENNLFVSKLNYCVQWCADLSLHGNRSEVIKWFNALVRSSF